MREGAAMDMERMGRRGVVGLVVVALWLGVAPVARAADETHRWSKLLGGIFGNAWAWSVASDPEGNVLVAGYTDGSSIDLGGGALPSQGGFFDVVLAKYSPSGAHLWSKRFGGTGEDWDGFVASDWQGNVLFAAWTDSPAISLGGAALFSQGDFDIVVAKYTPLGAHLWSKRLGGASADLGASVASDREGNVLLAGRSRSPSIDLGGGALPSRGSSDIVLVRYSPSGAHQWSKRLGGTGVDVASSVASDWQGNVLLTGWTDSLSIDLGGGTLPSQGGFDIVLATYGRLDGGHTRSKRLGGPGDDFGYSVAADPQRNVLLAGTSTSSSIDLGGGPRSSLGQSDIVLAKYDGSLGHLWSKRLGGSGFDEAASVASDAAGSVLLAGGTDSPSIDFGGGALASRGGVDIVLAKYSASGGHEWSKRPGGTEGDLAHSVASDPTGEVLLAGESWSPSIDLGGGALASQGGINIVLAKYRGDTTAPVARFDQDPVTVEGWGTETVAVLTTDPLPVSSVTGTATDDLSGIDSVTIYWFSRTSGRLTTAEAYVWCDYTYPARASCFFRSEIPPTILPGVYDVFAWALDRAGNTNGWATRMEVLLL
ncbi:MAG: SBBP repeat-containing protein [Acidobacteria bacterium]|nr:SBBP repeat-containing protein [Acidobacteriota bacterium]